MIELFSFGRMVVNGKTYSGDIIIYPDGRIKDSWWRKSGHRLDVADIADLIATKPKVIVIGTGVYGYMQPDLEVEQVLIDKGISMVAQPTKKAWQTYNELTNANRVGAGFHVGC